MDEVRRAEFFRKGRKKRELIKGKKWLLLSRWKNLTPETTRRAEPAVPIEPAGVQSLPAQGELWRGFGTTATKGPCSTIWRSGWINCGGSGCPRFEKLGAC